MSTEITVALPLTSVEEYSKTAAALADLKQRYGKVVFDVTTTKGMEAARKGRAELRSLRVNLEATRKTVKEEVLVRGRLMEEVLVRGRLIDSEAKRINAELEALEDPIDEQIKAEEKAERERKERERERVAAIQDRIATLGMTAASMAGKNSDEIYTAIQSVAAEEISDALYAEFIEKAKACQDAALARLRQMHTAALAHETEQHRMQIERAELDRLRAEQEQRDRETLERAQAEQRARDAEVLAARAKIEAEERESRARIEAQEREAQAKRDEQDRIAAEKREAERKELEALRARVEATRREHEERERKAREEIEAKERAEREAKDAQEREQRRQEAELMDGMQMLETFVERYGQRAEFREVSRRINVFLEKHKQAA